VKTRFILLGLLCAANLAQADLSGKGRERQHNYVDEGPWQEQILALPAFGKMDWVELVKPVTVKSRLFIDRQTLQLADDRTVRLTLLQLSSGGIENISREGIHCGQRTQRSYAYGDTVHQRWIESQRTEWRKLDRNNEAMKVVTQALCPENTPPLNADELANNLRQASTAAGPAKIEPNRQ